jgi:hypothetical protein
MERLDNKGRDIMQQPQLKKKSTFDKDRSRYNNFQNNDSQTEQRFSEPSIKRENTFTNFNNNLNNNFSNNENHMVSRGYEQSNSVYNENNNDYEHKHNGRKSTGGLILIALGVMFILQNVFGYNMFSMEKLWPIFVLIPGLSFEFGYFTTRRNPGVLVPGGILTTIGGLFFFETYTNWMFSEYTWPIYILAVAVGLFQLYLFGGRKKGLLIPVFILTTLSVVFMASGLMSAAIGSIILPVALILLGISKIVKEK